ncbi:transporter [Clostridium thermosuccinogenes]|uniref:Energy-coupling factor transporter transmembrane protein EcfT n=1 Tax=Clostridium thermosuccinogenes TaxID=84032 RepID=A0A2K2EXH8_9CLOT|nr:energy-coupling factor transporter transmembrane component T [Pseudoclostridium thermosuccinogenes]AUS98113.1 transporter [Pseudoclostridium thermosuccinogenes]PNT91232.1 transporter [Pseudoclostridium thermosuccinogenes]PNT95416.1 transporter [Pseudoclostridium thermosuccinogenes]PNT96592.1 transporter [Pseudoclostridium thermosuccinogenes]
MIKDITIGQYIPGESYLHKADPRTKILLTVFLMVILLLINTYAGFGLFVLFTLAVIVSSGIPIRYTLKGLKPVMFIIIFTALINLFSGRGTPIFQFGFLKITHEGVDMTIKMTLRLSLLIMTASLLTLTTTPILLTDGIEKLMNPFKRFGVPSHEIAMMMTIALRFIPTLLEETDKIMKAQAARGADFDTGNLIQRAKSFIPVLVPLFVSAFRRADELANAMEARCYRGSEGRTRMKQLQLTGRDYGISAVTLIFSAAVLYLQYM